MRCLSALIFCLGPAAARAAFIEKARNALSAAEPASTAPALPSFLAARPASKAPPALPRFLDQLAGRRLDQAVDYDAQCLSAFGQCELDLKADGCAPCVLSLVTEEDDESIDLPDDAEDWGCQRVVEYLQTKDFCPKVDPVSHSATLLCSVWSACAAAVDTDGTPAPAAAPKECSATECDVAHQAWVGDGRCDRDGCYNTQSCNWDGGDCCQATCEGECSVPFNCRDPQAQGCGARQKGALSLANPNGKPFDYALYSVIAESYAAVAAGTVPPGAAFNDEPLDICLADGCYVFEAQADAEFRDGGSWLVEAADSAGRLQRAASGISPSVCSFSVGETQFCPDQCSVKTECRDHAYQMELFDAGFNEWGFVDYTIHQHDARGTRGAEVASGSLQTGHFGVHDLCIREPGCYSVTLAWGWWAEEVSWVLGEKHVGVAASGGAPAQCDFSVGGDFCPATCMPSPQLTGCGEDKLPYELELYDDEGDGWAGALYSIIGDDDTIVATGTLLGGFQGEDGLCLASGCYDFKFAPSGANAKPAWALGDPTEGGAVFSGAHEADCAFAVGGAECPSGAHAKDPCGFAGKETPPPTALFTCATNEALLVLRLTDSWGDGWNGADISVADASGNVLHTATLTDGAYKEFPYCMAPGCYSITATSGEWREEVTWQAVEQLPDGSTKILNSGAAPEECGIELTAGSTRSSCDVGCSTLSAAQDDWTDGQGDDEFWNADDGAYYYGKDDATDDKLPARCVGDETCTVNENLQGWKAASSVMDCLDNQVPMRAADDPFEPDLWEKRPALCLGTYDWQELDAFEQCAQELNDAPGTLQQQDDKAKECMRILAAAVPDESEPIESSDELVKRLATMVYYDGDAGFCDCATDELAIPHCADFDDFRSVVREAHEACDALDQIDCAYLGAYADACRTAVVDQFGVLDFSREEQCAYVDRQGCGGLPIPSVRRWDCLLESNYELSESQKSLVMAVISECGGGTDDATTPQSGGREPSTDDQPAAPSSKGHDDDPDAGRSSAGVALIVVACLASAAVGLALLYVFYQKRQGGGGALRTAFAPLPGTPSAFDSPFGGAWDSSVPETPGTGAPPSFEEHVENPMRGGYEAPGLGDPEGV